MKTDTSFGTTNTISPVPDFKYHPSVNRYSYARLKYNTIYHQELPNFPVQPEITCSGVPGSITLSAPDGFTNYKWSTGETTQSVLVPSAGTYQCWVEQGIGMIGSKPIMIQAQSGGSQLSTNEISNSQKEILGYYDFMGRPIQSPEHKSPFIIRYTDGSTDRRMSLESNS